MVENHELWRTIDMHSFIIIFFASILSRSEALTNVGGVLLQNTIWSSNGNANPYYLISDVYVPRNVTLIIRPGVQILFNNGDFEILVKGFLQVNGNALNPVLFYNGTGTNTKWMITFQSTNLTKSTIVHASFIGPKNALQINTVAVGLPQNTGVLDVQNTNFRQATTVAANGKLFRLCFFFDSIDLLYLV